MLDTFLFAFNAVAPILLLMLLGFCLNRAHFFDPQTLKKMNTFSFRFCVSAMMFRSMYEMSSLSDIRPELMGFILLYLTSLTAFGWAAGQLFTQQRSRRGVIIQNSFRSNFAVIGISLAVSLGGTAGGGVSASLQFPTVVYYNIVAVLCLTVYSEQGGQSVDLRNILKRIATNPMILGLVSGAAVLLLRDFIPRDSGGELVFSLQRDLPFLYSPIDSLATIATPLLLVLLGAQVNFNAVGNMKKEVITGVFMRLIFAPALGFSLAFLAQRAGLIQLSPPVVSAFLGIFGSPVAVASAVMAEEMGNDAELARQYVVWSCALSTFTLLVWIFCFRHFGLL